MTHYDPSKWTSHLLDIEGSMVREIMGRVTMCVGFSVVVVGLYDFGPAFFHRLAIPETGHLILGTSLGLLLVFRTNSSNDRFWEGRKQWGSIVNETRNLARQADTWLAADRHLANRVILWTITFAYATMHRLRSLDDVGATRQSLPADEVQTVEQSGHVPLAVARKLTRLMYDAHRDGLIDAIQLRSLDLNVQALIDYCGACERIRSTPAPYSYIVHLRRALIVYCMTLPLALVQKYGWEAIPATLVIAYVLFGIEEIGVEIENPFEEEVNDLPLEEFCAMIDQNLRTMVETDAVKG
jgi:putative membrane protein